MAVVLDSPGTGTGTAEWRAFRRGLDPARDGAVGMECEGAWLKLAIYVTSERFDTWTGTADAHAGE